MLQATPSLDELLQTDSELSSLPEIYIRVSDLLDNENSSATQIGQVVETDPALTSRILKMVNSAYYGYSNRIASISQAITILGRDRLRQILIGSVLGGVFGKMTNHVISMQDFWYHSVKTALLCRDLAKSSRLSEISDVLFTAGLLHELGRLILSHKLPDLYQQVEATVQNGNTDICQAEQEIIGYTHSDTADAFIRKWGLPEILSATAKFHHRPQDAGEHEHSEEILLVYLANILSTIEEPTEVEDVERVLQKTQGWRELGLNTESVFEACEQADKQTYQVMDSLGMGQMIIEDDD